MTTELSLPETPILLDCEKADSSERILCWFSCGAASAVAAKETIEHAMPGQTVEVVCCDTRRSEHPDNFRFFDACERWFGQPIVILRNHDYPEGVTVDDIFERHRYMSGVRGARCTTELKKIPRFRFAQPDDIHVFGFTAEETARKKRFELRNPDLRLKWPCIEAGITKRACKLRLSQAGIALPMMYRLFDPVDAGRYGVTGFDNNNCPGCVKSSSPWYWSMVRKYFPDVFMRRCQQSRKFGVRLVEISHHKRIFLDELPVGPFKKGRKKENMSCGPECGGSK